MRMKVRPTQAEGSHACFRDGLIRESGTMQGLWLRLERRFPFVDMYWSRDGETWNQVQYRAVLLDPAPWADVQVTAGVSGPSRGSVRFDNISYEKMTPVRPNPDLTEVMLPKRTREMHIVRVEHPGKGSFNPFLLMPGGMEIRDIRGVVLSSGSKEVQLDDGAITFDSGSKSTKGKLRKPADMPDYEGGLYRYEDGNYHGVLLEQQGLIRLGGAWPPEVFPEVIAALEEETGVPLSTLPMFPTGASFAGGYSARFAHLYRDQITASAPTLLGTTGVRMVSPAWEVPHLHVIGEKDGAHYRELMQANGVIREADARWGAAVMWTLGHRHSEADALIYPWFLSFLHGEKIPEYEEGWFGDLSTWRTKAPRVLPVSDVPVEQRAEMTWLPNEHVATIWQAFVSYKPEVMIHFPTFDGYAPFMGPKKGPCTVLPAGVDFPLIASGPLSDSIRLTLRNGKEELKAEAIDNGNPYSLKVRGLSARMYSLILEAEPADEVQVSKPVMLLVVDTR